MAMGLTFGLVSILFVSETTERSQEIPSATRRETKERHKADKHPEMESSTHRPAVLLGI